MNIIGDVNGMTAVLVDDIVDTGGTLARAANALIEKGARERLCLLYPSDPLRKSREDDLRITHQRDDRDGYRST